MRDRTKWVKEVSCPDCGAKRTTRKDSVKGDFARCNSCRARFAASRPHPERITGKWESCVVCGTKFWKFKYDKKRSLCSRKCASKTIGGKLKAKEPDSIRFWKKVKKTNGCWEWTGALFKSGGYGAFRRCDEGKRGLVRANRFAWVLETGTEPPSNLNVCHKCDNPPCVRFDHLFLGTTQDNMDDLKVKGRWWSEKRIKKHLRA